VGMSRTKRNAVVGRCLVLLYDCQKSGIFPDGLTLVQIQVGAGIRGTYLVHKVSKWRTWYYVVGKPVVLDHGRARWHYRIASKGIRFVESLPSDTLDAIRGKLAQSIVGMPDIPLPTNSATYARNQR
jgi:hypothetical protein